MSTQSENLPWRSYGCESNGCVEVAFTENETMVRDSKMPDGPILKFSRLEWDAFVAGIREGELAP